MFAFQNFCIRNIYLKPFKFEIRQWEPSFLPLRKIGDMNFPCSCSQGTTALFFNNFLTSTLRNDLCHTPLSNVMAYPQTLTSFL